MTASKGYFERISNWSGLPGELPPGKTLVELLGSNRVLIEHHKGLLCYSYQKIIVGGAEGNIQITGENMSIVSMTAYQLVICGRIYSICLKEG